MCDATDLFGVCLVTPVENCIISQATSCTGARAGVCVCVCCWLNVDTSCVIVVVLLHMNKNLD
jgi:hypothetical protein